MSDFCMHINLGLDRHGVWVGEQQFRVIEELYRLTEEGWLQLPVKEVKSKVKLKLDKKLEEYLDWLMDIEALDQALYEDGIVFLTEFGVDLAKIPTELEELAERAKARVKKREAVGK